jgi:hypothetical protein
MHVSLVRGCWRWALSIGLFTTLPIGAQQVRGTVRDSVTSRPIAGAVVMVQDSTGQTVGRTVSDQRGRYVLPAPPASQRLRLVRLGFRPREVILRTGTADSLVVAMMPVPTLLEPTQATVGATCARRPDREAAFALLQQARAALLATVVAREANPASVLRLKYARTFEPRSEHIAQQEVRMESTAVTPTSFTAMRSAVDFRRLGFTMGDGLGRRFLGVDADVLLDSRFADAYCFSLHRTERARPDQIGLDFSAARSQPGRIDIEGTVWIDTVARRLQDIEYRYAGLARALNAMRPEGHTFFREMPNGVAFIDRWSLRAVLSVTDTVSGDETTQFQRQIRTRVAVTETGGELADAAWPDGSSWHAPLGTLHVQVTNRRLELPNGTRVHLIGTDYSATIDTTGGFEIARIVPGPYTLSVVDPRLATVGAEIRTSFQFVASRDSAIEHSVRLPTARDFVASRCLETHRYDVAARVYLFGRLMYREGTPVKDAAISVLRERTPGNWQPIKTRMQTDGEGYFQFCDAEIEEREAVIVRASLANGATVDARYKLSGDLDVLRVTIDPRL